MCVIRHTNWNACAGSLCKKLFWVAVKKKTKNEWLLKSIM